MAEESAHVFPHPRRANSVTGYPAPPENPPAAQSPAKPAAALAFPTPAPPRLAHSTRARNYQVGFGIGGHRLFHGMSRSLGLATTQEHRVTPRALYLTSAPVVAFTNAA